MFLIKGHLISYNNILFNQYSNRLNHLQTGMFVWSVSKYFSKIEADCQTVYTLIKHELSDLVYTACFGISVTILKCSVVNLFFAFCYFTDAAQTQEYWNYCKWKEKKKTSEEIVFVFISITFQCCSTSLQMQISYIFVGTVFLL